MKSSGIVETTLPTEDIPPEERFACWHELIWNSFAPTDWSSDYADRYHIKHRMLEIGDVQIWEASISTSTLKRTEKLIRKSDPEKVCIAFNRRGVLLGDTAGRQMVCGPGDLYCHDTSHPSKMMFRSAEDRRSFDGLTVMVPRRNLSLARRNVDQVVGRRISANVGMGALLSTFISQLAHNSTSFGVNDGSRLEFVVGDLVSATLAGTMDDLGCVPEESRRNALLLSVKEFMLQNLSDPELTPSAVAAAHHISISYLHRIFQHEEITVAAWIRQRRLAQAYAKLTDAAHYAVPIHAIASLSGFARAADFTRAFRNAYGMSPTECRNLHSTHRTP